MTWMAEPFPPRIAMGMSCDPGWQVRVVTTQQGAEQRNLEWTDAKHTYDAGLAVRTATDYQVVLDHFHMARGRTHSWPIRDPLDHRVEQSNGVVLADDESPANLQLHKRYGSNDFAYYRKITRPKLGSVAVYLNGTPLAQGIDWTLDFDTGVLSMLTAAAAPEDLAWSGQFWVPCRYDIEKLPARVVNRQPGGRDLLVQVEGIAIVEVRE